MATHCCGAGETPPPPELPEITITIHNCKYLNAAVALKKWAGEDEEHFKKRDRKLVKLLEKAAELATPPGEHVNMYNFPPSYIHPEP